MERRRERVVYSRIRGDTITTNPCTPTIPSFLPLPPHLPSSFSLPSRRWRFRLGFLRGGLFGLGGLKKLCLLFIILAGQSPKASTDQSAVDLKIPSKLGAFAFSVIQVAGIVAVMSHIAWQSFIVFIPVIGTCIWYQQYYISTARELARLIGVCKAPLIQHSAESISGSTTIRSFNQESRFMDINMKLIDSYLQPRFYSAGAMEWLCFRLDMLSSFTFALALIFLISVQEGTIDPAFAGLVITYGLNLNVQQAWVVYNLCNLEAKIISVERILQYSSIPSEAPLVLEARKPDNDWPSQGEINIHDLQVRYAPHMPLVLRGLTCTLRAGMRTGVVGRTEVVLLGTTYLCEVLIWRFRCIVLPHCQKTGSR